MDQKVVCMFLLTLGISHGLECYLTNGENFNATIASKVTCGDDENVCFKQVYDGGESRGCEDFQLLKHGYEPVPQLDRCTKVEAEGEKGTICVCSESLCNTSTMLNGGMVLVF